MVRRTVLFALFSLLTLPASAGTVAKSHYEYYTIAGQTLVEIYDSMLKRGPHVGGEKAYASTSATSSQEGKLIQSKNCRINDYKLKIDFVIRLPKLQSGAKLTSAEKARFQRFSQFLRQHEETHRSIWMDCAANLEAKVAKVSGKSCSEAERKSERLWAEMRKSCNVRHQAFDAAEQKRLLQHPFLRYVLTKKSHTTNAAKVP